MGQCNISFIPAAILYANPGITREEFVVLLNQIRFSDRLKVPPMDFDEPLLPEMESPCFHDGIFGLAELLRLKINKPFHTSRDPIALFKENLFRHDKYDRSILMIQPRRGEEEWVSPKYFIRKRNKKLFVAEEKDRKLIFCDEPAIGKEYVSFRKGESNNLFRILKIGGLKREIENGYPKFTAIVDQEKLLVVPTYEEHDSLESLLGKHPEYNPDTCIDWSKTEGRFYIAGAWPFGDLAWEKIANRYYLRKDDIKESDFTSTVITAEAIRKKAWALFQFKGYNLTDKFLIENDDVMKTHQDAVFNYWITQYARKHKMTNTEFMRFRLENSRPYQRLPDDIAFHIVYQEALCDGLACRPKPPTVRQLLGIELRDENEPEDLPGDPDFPFGPSEN